MRMVLWVVVGVVAVSLLTYFGGIPLIRAYLSPPAVFDPATAGQPPDFSDVAAWGAHPAKESAALLIPAVVATASEAAASEAAASEAAAPEAAVFFVHPTTYFGPGGWNADFRARGYSAQLIEHMLATQASAFSDCCVIYAPLYRQAHIAAFVDRESDAGFRAFDVAYADIERGFSQFLKELQPGQGFYLAGHSQGTLHLQRLLANRVSGQPLREQLIAAYLIGYWLPSDIQRRNFPDIPYCDGASATGCVVTFDAYSDEGAGPPADTGVPHWYVDGWEWSDHKTSVCINPLSWERGRAPIDAVSHLGALPMGAGSGLLNLVLDRDAGFRYDSLEPLMAGHTGAYCDERSVLRVAPQLDNPFSDQGRGEDGSYHKYDWNLFYMNIRANVTQRRNAFHTRSAMAPAAGEVRRAL